MGLSLPAWAGWPQGLACPTPEPVAAAQADGLLQMASLIQDEWQARGTAAALVSRSGLNLRAIGHVYSHSGFLLGQAPHVRQLYLDCASGRPRVFDEGLAGFVRGVAHDVLPRLSVVWWPIEAAQDVARAATDDGLATSLVAPVYQAQAHAWSVHSQNCNQWVAEVVALAFARERDTPGQRGRIDAQHWLREKGYSGSVISLPWVGWLVAAAVLPHMGLAHHPEDNLQALRLEVSLPDSLERFVRRQWPQAERMEWCLRGREVVVRRGWVPLDAACTPRDGDQVRALLP